MAPVVAQECPGSNSNCSRPKNSVAPATTMLSRPPPPSPHQFFTTPTDSRLSIPPLNAERFSGSFEHFCSVRGLVVDYQLLLRVGEREVDLYSLHKEFMNRRGYNINEVPDLSLPIPPSKCRSEAFSIFIFSEKTRVLVENRQTAQLHRCTGHVSRRCRGGGSAGDDLRTVPPAIRRDLCNVVHAGTLLQGGTRHHDRLTSVHSPIQG